jgi:hypothetical protein
VRLWLCLLLSAAALILTCLTGCHSDAIIPPQPTVLSATPSTPSDTTESGITSGYIISKQIKNGHYVLLLKDKQGRTGKVIRPLNDPSATIADVGMYWPLQVTRPHHK